MSGRVGPPANGEAQRERWPRESQSRFTRIAVAIGVLLERNHGEIGERREGDWDGNGKRDWERLASGTERAWSSVECAKQDRADECGSWVPHRVHLRAGAPGVQEPPESGLKVMATLSSMN